ncbi:Coenzyme F420 hydrogenase/dehydrogenase, beta subunit C-terminal domain [Naasia sp. SYSU D00948]|uniref:Coenzyme F420 hydrogenase/dehydrogenase, beta subunit C-terminal domain n=1 Tax=Naasia sp. SYSU D00948 TaxID=2817379 RepID=UPI001B31218F|nr:Coenzyme F420 hydrogenase/dehydrogenase, beta subunit C-terminal domain [Naasia sp. SYSU D00948]
MSTSSGRDGHPGPSATNERLAGAVARVVRNGNCSGCGACALVSSRVSLDLDEDGFLRPSVAADCAVDAATDRREARLFRRTCPGDRLAAPRDPRPHDSATFGRYVQAWEAWAADPEVRFAGSSAGALTALSTWLVESGRAPSVVGAASDAERPARTVPVRITSRQEALAAAGSRYAPVGTVAGYDPSGPAPLVGKPCEVSAARQLNEALGVPDAASPIRLTFFCAGTPSQRATESLAAALGVPADQAVSLRYRGNGWPGEFRVVGRDGTAGAASYEESWGRHLGRNLQWRCKICPDGTGGDGDISVGDFWRADENGYPVFDDADGSSVVIARTERGRALVEAAIAAGVLVARPVSLDAVEAIQPLQRTRRETLLGRLAGRLAAGRRIPRYRGYGLLALAARHLSANLRAARGTRKRSLAPRRTEGAADAVARVRADS